MMPLTEEKNNKEKKIKEQKCSEDDSSSQINSETLIIVIEKFSTYLCLAA